MEEQTQIIICTCGSVIKDVDHISGCNDEGEDYGEVSATCKTCGKEWEVWRWGEWENKIEAINHLIGHIRGSSGEALGLERY